MPESAPEVTSPILAMSALGVKGGVRSSSESVVVCDFRRVVAAWMAVSGPLGRSGASLLLLVEALFVGGAREVWKCARRVCVVCVREMSLGRSLGGGILGVQRIFFKDIRRAYDVPAREAALYATYVLCPQKLLGWWGL